MKNNNKLKTETAIINRIEKLSSILNKIEDKEDKILTEKFITNLNFILNIKTLEQKEGLTKTKKKDLQNILKIADDYIKELT